jgi:hypothetical protein
MRAWYCDIDVSGRDEDVTLEEIQRRKDVVTGKILFCDMDVPQNICPVTENFKDNEVIGDKKDIANSPCGYDNHNSIKKKILKPSLVVESRNGFHLYWFAWYEPDGLE